MSVLLEPIRFLCVFIFLLISQLLVRVPFCKIPLSNVPVLVFMCFETNYFSAHTFRHLC
jgi:riboflavin transporter FmnP